jgi:hypothetical protein
MKQILSVGCALMICALVPVTAAQADLRGRDPELYAGDIIAGNIIDYRISSIYQSTAVIVMTGVVGAKKGYDSYQAAKDDAAKIKGVEAILENTAAKAMRYGLASTIVVKTTPENLALLQSDPTKLVNDPSIALDFKSMLLDPNIELFMPRGKVQTKFLVHDIVNEQGLQIGSLQQQNTGAKGSKFWRQTLDAQLRNERLDEAKAVYLEFDAMNTKGGSNDLDVVKITRETNLAKLYNSGPKLQPFVEAEMKRWKYDDAQKAKVRGAPAQPS